MQIFHVASECAGIISQGGLGDVVLQIAKQCATANHQTTIILPKYGKLDDEFEKRFGTNLSRAVEGASPEQVPLDFPGKTFPSAAAAETVRFTNLDYKIDGVTLLLCLVNS